MPKPSPHQLSWRTLAADGATQNFDHRQDADQWARELAQITGEWVGIEEWDHDSQEWWLVETAEPTP